MDHRERVRRRSVDKSDISATGPSTSPLEANGAIGRTAGLEIMQQLNEDK